METLKQHWDKFTHTYQSPEQLVLILTAVVVGVGGGFGAVIFRKLIETFHHLSFVTARDLLQFMGQYYIIIIPAIGGAIVGPMIYFFAREAKGHGVPEVMEAVALRGGRIRPVVVIVKALASAITIGTGGSVGREGPIVQIGSALGSTVGQWLNLSEERIRNLVACGAAAGIAATFNAPIAGVIFALEVIAGEFTTRYFSTVVISSVLASVIGRIYEGNVPAFVVPAYKMVSPVELIFYAILGVIAAFIATAFVRVLYWTEDLFDAWQFPEYLKPIVGGLLIGALGLYQPYLFGVGYDGIEQVLTENLAATTLVALVVLKVVATSITVGSGGSGGVFAPSLFIGAMFGGFFGIIVHNLFPNVTATSSAYAIVGMAAVFAGGARAPITAVLILFEMTNNYHLILPLMLATVVSTLLAEALHRESIYTMKLSRRGIRLERGHDIDVMQAVRVEEVMTRDIVDDTVSADLDLAGLSALFEKTHHHGFAVLDDDGLLCGVVSLGDLRRAIGKGALHELRVRDVLTEDVRTVFPDEPVWSAINKMAPRDLSRLPVVSRDNSRLLVGLVRRADILRAYNVGIMRRQQEHYRADQMRLGRLTGAQFKRITLTPNSPAVNKTLKELVLPQEVVVVSVRRGYKLMIPHGDTKLLLGDRVTLLCEEECLTRIPEIFGDKVE